MRFDIAITYLIGRFFYRFITFFVHWYGHTFLIFYRGIAAVLKQLAQWPVVKWLIGLPLIAAAAIIYIFWASIPVYLIARIFYERILF